MKDLSHLSLAWDLPDIDPKSVAYRPPSWPPPPDWPVSLNLDGSPRSLYGEDIWDFEPWARRRFKLNMTGGQQGSRALPINKVNSERFRLLCCWLIWGPRAASRPSTLMYHFNSLRPIFAFATAKRIDVANLVKFPHLLSELADGFTAKTFEATPVLLHRLWDDQDKLGFLLLDPASIQRLVELIPREDRKQTPYIPARIWSYQVGRLRECLDEFLEHEQRISDCFKYCLNEYALRAGSLERAVARSGWASMPRPFGLQSNPQGSARDFDANPRLFGHVAIRFGLSDLVERWVGTDRSAYPHLGVGVGVFSQYLSLVQYASLAYLLCFTVQRKNEAASLRSDCLLWEEDATLGRIPLICGETTKTISDDDARWPTSPSVTVAVQAAKTIAQLRMICAAAHPKVAPSANDQANPYLFHRAFEPFSAATDAGVSYPILPALLSYRVVIEKYPRLFDVEKLRITPEDLNIALMFAPEISSKREFSAGSVWPFTWHQLRRTAAVNMFASGVVSDGSVQHLMKHTAQTMTRYYGRDHSRLRLNEISTAAVISTMYEVRAKDALNLSSERFVSPAGAERKQAIVVNLIGDRDAKQLAAAGRAGEATFRAVRVGACTKRGDCEYGGIESVARCAGGDGGKPCADVLFDRSKGASIAEELENLKKAISEAPVGSPRQRALTAERRAMENYLDIVRR